jgi:thiol-disulfide isomerase/thioredoxin
MKRLFLNLCLATVYSPFAAGLHAADVSADDPLLAKEKEISKQRMLQIYDAIQAYRKDHKDLPAFLSDLHPKYIADTNLFLCPTALRLGQEIPFPELRDPNLLVQFGYEFSARPIQGMFGYSGPMTMGEWKRMQMEVAGGVVPILRCFAYDQVLNVSFDGQFYESPLTWEQNFADKIDSVQLEPRHLRLLLLKKLGGETNGEALAFQELQDAVAGNNKGVVVSDQPLSEKDQQWNQEVAQSSLAAADLARQFLTKHPQSQQAKAAAGIEQDMVLKAAEAGSADGAKRLDDMVTEKLKTPGLGEDDRFELRIVSLRRSLAGFNGHPGAEKNAALSLGARALIAEFPKRSEPYQILLSSAAGIEAAKASALIDELRQMPDAPDIVKQQAEAALRRMNIAGHPPDIQFTALDGREVDLAKLKGKVVLVDFWATWCGPCVGEIPHVKAAYDQFHDKGFEIVGISFDGDRAALEKFVKSKDLPWPQYFDGKNWQNKFGQQYGIQSIPTMWLVNRKGDVADTNARDDLAGKVKRLLDED